MNEVMTVKLLSPEQPDELTNELFNCLEGKVLDVVITFNAMKQSMAITDDNWITLSEQLTIVPMMLTRHPRTFHLVTRLINIHNAEVAKRIRHGQRN